MQCGDLPTTGFRGRTRLVVRGGVTETRAFVAHFNQAEQPIEAATIRPCTDTYRKQAGYLGKTSAWTQQLWTRGIAHARRVACATRSAGQHGKNGRAPRAEF